MNKPELKDYNTEGSMIAPYGAYDYEAYSKALDAYIEFTSLRNKEQIIDDYMAQVMPATTAMDDGSLKTQLYNLLEWIDTDMNTGRSKSIKMSFETYFDGCYGVDPEPNTSNTFQMGVCGLNFNEKNNTLTVHIRRPGILIGKSGVTIEKLKTFLGCNVEIKEVTKF